MLKTLKIRPLPLLLVLLITLISIAVRMYHIPELMDWTVDGGGDLLIARNILYHGNRTLVGPFLSVDNFYTPPTYFYILAALLWLTHTPVGVVVAFGIINILSGLLLAALARKMVDTTTGLLVFALFSISAVMIAHSKSVYQTYPVIPFYVLSLYLLWTALKNNKLTHLLAALISFGVAASIYPSPLLLLPYIIFLVYIFVRKKFRGKSKSRSVIQAVVFIALCSLPPYIPQLIFEYQHGFPTLMASRGSSGGLSEIFMWPTHYAVYAYQLINQFFGIEGLFHKFYAHFVALGILAVLGATALLVRSAIMNLSKKRRLIYTKVFAFAASPWLVVSFLLAIVFWEPPFHRIWIYFPTLFLLGAVATRLALEANNIWLKICVVFLVFFYIVGNIRSYWQWTTIQENMYGKTEAAARYIISDVKKREVPNHDYGVLYYTSYGISNYSISAVFYFLQEYDNYPVPFLQAGNDVERSSLNNAHNRIVYLICKSDVPVQYAPRLCSEKFLARNPQYTLDRAVQLPMGLLYIYTKKPVTET